MKYIRLTALLCLFIACGYSQDSEIINKSREATVKILVYGDSNKIISYGTGFFLNNDSTIVTCFHVAGVYLAQVMGNNRVHVSWLYYNKIRCITSSNDTIDLHHIETRLNDSDFNFILHDFTVLRPNKKIIHSIKWLTLSNKNDKLNIGEKIYYSGYPLSLPLLSNTGIISGLDGDFIYVQAPFNNGNSGGALLNSKGKVIGIIDIKGLQLTLDLDNYLKSLEHLMSTGINSGMIQNDEHGNPTDISGVTFNYKLVKTLHDNLNTGIGGAKNVALFKDYLH